MSFSEARRAVQKKELRDSLAVATNPHLKSEVQAALWHQLAPDSDGSPVRKSIMTPELRAQGMRIQAELDKEAHGI